MSLYRVTGRINSGRLSHSARRLSCHPAYDVRSAWACSDSTSPCPGRSVRRAVSGHGSRTEAWQLVVKVSRMRHRRYLTPARHRDVELHDGLWKDGGHKAVPGRNQALRPRTAALKIGQKSGTSSFQAERRAHQPADGRMAVRKAVVILAADGLGRSHRRRLTDEQLADSHTVSSRLRASDELDVELVAVEVGRRVFPLPEGGSIELLRFSIEESRDPDRRPGGKLRFSEKDPDPAHGGWQRDAVSKHDLWLGGKVIPFPRIEVVGEPGPGVSARLSCERLR